METKHTKLLSTLNQYIRMDITDVTADEIETALLHYLDKSLYNVLMYRLVEDLSQAQTALKLGHGVALSSVQHHSTISRLEKHALTSIRYCIKGMRKDAITRRLGYYNKNGTGMCSPNSSNYDCTGKCQSCALFKDAFAKLAAYENSGLSPKQVQQVAERNENLCHE